MRFRCCAFWPRCCFSVFALLVIGISAAYGIDIERDSTSLLYEPAQSVTVMQAPEPAVESPAILTVFTRDKIKALGARTIPELLEFTPGFQPWRSVAGDWWPGPRGVFDSNRSFIVMIDGVSINNQFLGSPYWSYDLLDLSRYDRIEIVRGPGSAIYGSNAFLAVINCITPSDLSEEGNLKTTIGTFKTTGISLEKGFKLGRTRAGLYITGLSSDGQERYVPRDIFGSAGKTQDGFTKRDLMLKITDPRGWTFLASHVESHREGYIGYFDHVNDLTFFRRSNDMLSLRYHHDQSSGGAFTAGIFYNRFSDSETAQVIEPGITVPIGGNPVTYPLGAMEQDHSRDSVWGLDFLLKMSPNGRHRWSFGGELKFIDLIESAVYGSFASPNDPSQLTFMPGAYPNPERVSNWSGMVQDDITLGARARLVLGARYDRHSRFGGSVNPRAGLIYRLNRRWTGKLLYGTAYRNPDFHEMANRALNSEKISTSEFQLLGDLFNGWFTKVNFFHNELKDRIESGLTVSDYRNIGKTHIDGMEMEIRKRFWAGQEAFANTSTFWQHLESSASSIAPGLPHNKLNLGYSCKVESFDVCIWSTFTSRWLRNKNDPRQPLPGTGMAHMTIRKTGFPGPQDTLQLRIRNLLNSYSAFSPAYPGDSLESYPRAGREISLEMAWSL